MMTCTHCTRPLTVARNAWIDDTGSAVADICYYTSESKAVLHVAVDTPPADARDLEAWLDS